jgi:hypothetical protein
MKHMYSGDRESKTLIRERNSYKVGRGPSKTNQSILPFLSLSDDGFFEYNY